MYDTGEGLGAPGAVVMQDIAEEGVSASGNLLIDITTTQNNSGQVVSVQHEFKKPGVATVQFNIQRGEPSSPLYAVWTEAEILWTVGGNTIRRKVTVGDAVSITGLAKSVVVRVIDRTPLQAGLLAMIETYKVFITISPGARATIEQPPVIYADLYSTDVLAAATLDVPIPEGAGVNAVAVLFSKAGTAVPDQGVIASHFADLSMPALVRYDPRSIYWAPVAPGAKFVQVYNATLATINARVIFGVDG
jgi:hypothetical protein